MENNNENTKRIRMPAGAAIACILITILCIVGVVYLVQWIDGTVHNNGSDGSALIEATPLISEGPSVTPGTNSGKLPSDNLAYTSPESSASPINDKLAMISKCKATVVSIDVTMKSGYTSVLSGSGSGVLISPDGYIATCNHVVSGASEIYVYLDDGTKYTAKIVGVDPITDLAVIKVETTAALPYATIGRSSNLIVGEEVYAIGNALGELSNTYTSGSISGLDRIIEIDGQSMTLLQTDAAINHGNSGGGLFRTDGTLIGIVNAKSSGSGIEGLGFAIPSDIVKDIASDLMDYGFVKGRPYLGVTAEDVTMSSGFGYFGGYYTFPRVTSIMDGSAAANGGMKVNDIILKINGETVNGVDSLNQMINSYKSGDTITVTVQRGNTSVDLTITLSERSA